MDFADVVKEHCGIPFERLRIVRELDALGMFSIHRGVIFIFAVWSGPSIIAFRRFTQVLSRINTDGLDLAVLNTDCFSSEAGIALWGRNVGGGGETLWIRDGVVVGRALLYVANTEPEVVKLTQQLLD